MTRYTAARRDVALVSCLAHHSTAQFAMARYTTPWHTTLMSCPAYHSTAQLAMARYAAARRDDIMALVSCPACHSTAQLAMARYTAAT